MRPAICLTFDDLFVENWCAARPVLDEFGARVTFCVSHLHTATPDQIAGLRALQADGHEIAFHSRTHPKLRAYLDAHGLDHWLAHEIDAGMAEHRAAGFPAASFACPFHASTPETRAALAPRFAVIRAAGPRSVTEATLCDRIYHAPGPDNAVDTLGFADMQHRAFPGWARQHRLLDAIAERRGAGVFAGHDIRAGKSGPGFYSTRRQIRHLLQAASERGLSFLTLSDLAGQSGRNTRHEASIDTAPIPAATRSAGP
jgi:peptidoglycan/xylan/chitin deacetylase (PgdA/CDA1 family)